MIFLWPGFWAIGPNIKILLKPFFKEHYWGHTNKLHVAMSLLTQSFMAYGVHTRMRSVRLFYILTV